MKSKLVSVAPSALAVFFLALVPAVPAPAQEAGSKPVVIPPVAHDVSPPLRDMVAAAPPEAPPHQRVIPLRRPPRPTLPAVANDSALQQLALPLVSTTGGQNFDGIGADGVAPPDTNGSVGSTQYVQIVNLKYAVYDKTNGNLVLGPTPIHIIWSGFSGDCANGDGGDPNVLFDKSAQRWVVGQINVNDNAYCMAVSTSSDATGRYARYEFSSFGSGSDLPDYPKLGVWSDAYYFTANIFFLGRFFSGAEPCAFDRANMLAGGNANMICLQQSSSVASLLPSDLDGSMAPPSGEPNFYLTLGGSSTLSLYKFHVDFAMPSNSTFTGPTTLSVDSFAEACGGGTCIPQPGTNQQLDSLADRLMFRLAYRNFGDHESLVVNHSVTAGSSVGVRWYEIRSPNAQAPTVFQQGTFAPDSKYRWMGSIGMDQSGDIAVGYSRSSAASGDYPSVYYTGRVPSDPAGTMEGESQIFAGTGSQTGSLSRWGDYSAMSIDPVDDCTFFYTTEYIPLNGSFNWHTRVASFKFASCGGAPTPDFSLSLSPTSQTATTNGGKASYSLTVTSLNGYSGTVNLNAATCPPTLTCGVTPGSVTVTSGGSALATLNVTTGSTTASNYTVTVTGSDTSGSPSHQTSTTVVVTDFSLNSSPSSATVTQGNTANYGITASSLNTFSGSVGLTVTSCPSGLTCSLTLSSVTVPSGGTSGSSTLNVVTTTSTPPGNYNVTVTGTNSTITHTVTVSLTVNLAGANPDFTITASPSSQTVRHGSSTTYTVTVSAVNGFNGTVSFSVSGLPPRTNGSFNPSSVTGSGTSTLTVTANRKASVGTFTLTITGTSGGLSHSVNVTLTVT